MPKQPILDAQDHSRTFKFDKTASFKPEKEKDY